jgi:phage/plasmid-like protein (TIGR03299 family)
LATIGKDWEPVQNSEAFAFFNKFVENGDMKMETAGSLQGGNYVWGLAKIKKSFELFGGDVINPYLLFTNPHKYGLPVDIRFTAIRVECNNTLTMALGKKANFFKASHRMVFDPEMAKEALGIASKKMDDYIEQVQVLGENQYTKETVDNYFSEVFPVQVVKGKDESKKEKSKNHKEALIALENQPGLEYAPGSWWQAYNAVTYITDHLMARTQEARVTNIWYGQTKELKIKAFEKARDYAFKA